MMEYPVNLRLRGRPCAIVGGGAVAERKADALLKAGAHVWVISPELSDNLGRWAEQGELAWLSRQYQPGELKGYFLVFCATGDAAVNRAAAEEARSAGALVNVVDAPEMCDFTVPSHVARGELLLTVSTGGSSPALAKRLREELEELFGPEYGYFLEIVSRAREDVRSRLAFSRSREEFWRKAIDEETMLLLRQGRVQEAEERLNHAISRIGTQS